MKIVKVIALATLAASIVSCKSGKVDRKDKLATEKDSVSYALGSYVSLNFRINEDFKDLDLDVFNQAIKEAGDKSKSLLKQEDIAPILIAYTQKMAEKRGASAKKEGEAFLAENKKKQGVVTTASGLQYSVIKEGNGEKPTINSTVKVHYTGKTPKGETFDSSVERGQPAQFPLNGVIKGWTEGLQLMKVGAKYKFYIPQELAYGANAPQGGNGPIKAYMPLVFEVELLEIVK